MSRMVLTSILSAAAVLPGLICAGEAAAQPVISSVQGPFSHAEEVTIQGAGFGSKEQARPHRVSYLSPDPDEAFQQTGQFSSTHWFLTGDIMVFLQDAVTRLSGVDTHRYYGRLEYSPRGNWEAGGYSAGINTSLPETRALYISWWEYMDPAIDFSRMWTGNADIKWIYFSPGRNPAHAITITDEGTRMQSGAANGVAGDTREEQDANISSDYRIGFYGRPMSWAVAFPVIRGSWYFVEIIEKINSAPGVHDGWMELRFNNKRVYRAAHTDIFSGGSTPDAASYPNIRFGGNYGFEGEGTYYRYYGDFYVDASFSRVLLGDAAAYEDCTRFEVQVPTSWSDASITFTANQGAFSAGQTAYLYVFDGANMKSAGFPVVMTGDAQRTPDAPANLRMQ